MAYRVTGVLAGIFGVVATGALLLPACVTSGGPSGSSGSGNNDDDNNNTGDGGSTTDGSGGDPSTGAGGTGNSTGGTTSGSTGGAGNVEQPPPLTDGCDGWASRYWDCCKPHCAWTANSENAGAPARTCNAQNQTQADANETSGCDMVEGSPGNSFVCYDNAPWDVSPTLSYGYVATHGGNNDFCGRCYQIQFKGTSHNAGDDPGSAALSGKTMIVQVTNVGFDVSGDGQFDLMIPGGGLGQRTTGCPAQWGVQEGELGANQGGFLATCKSMHGGNGNHAALKSCVTDYCNSVFGSNPAYDQLMDACEWFVNWFEVADNPAFLYQEVACPDDLVNRTNMDRRPRNDVQNTCL